MSSQLFIRMLAAVLALLTLGAGLAARADTLPPFWAKYSGVALWCTLVYWMVVFVRPGIRVWRACLIAAAIGCGVEFFQMTPYPAAWGRAFPPSRLVFGTTFRAPDLPAYLVGAALGAAVHAGVLALRARRRCDTVVTNRAGAPDDESDTLGA